MRSPPRYLSSPVSDLFLLAAACTLIFAVSAGHPVIGSSSRYYEAAREMLQLGDWWVPHLHYAPYAEKPVLVYWLGAIARSVGTGPRITSLPSLLATIVAVWCTWALGRAVHSRGLGLGAALLLLGTSFVQAMEGVLTPDTILTAAVGATWWTFWEWERSERTSNAWLVAFYVSIGIGWMDKGPVALLVPAVGIASYSLWTDGWRGPFQCLWQLRPSFGLLIVALNLPWTLAWWARDPRLVEFFYWRINVDAFLYGNYNHPNPWWYYGPVLMISLVPFTFVALPALLAEWWRCLRAARWQRSAPVGDSSPDRALSYLTCCTLCPLVFLSLSSAKLGTYLMPLMPPVAVLIAMHIARYGRTPQWMKWVAAVQTAIMLAVLGIATVLFVTSMRTHRLVLFGNDLLGGRDPSSIGWNWMWIVVLVVSMVFLGSLGFLVAALRDRLVAGFFVLALGATAGTSMLLGTVDRLVPRLDAGALVMDLRARGGDDRSRPPGQRDQVLVDQSTVQDYVIPLVLGRRVCLVGRAKEAGLGYFLQAHPSQGVPLPGTGESIVHPYDVSGDNTTHPWLWSQERLRNAWVGDRRLWFLTSDRTVQDLEHEGLTVNRISHVRNTWLVSNQP